MVSSFPEGGAAMLYLAGTAAFLTAIVRALGYEVPYVSSRWGIPRQWSAFGIDRYAGLFGFNLGLGWRTRVNSNLFWLMVIIGLAVGDFVSLIWLFVPFALARAIPVLVIAVVRGAVTRRYVERQTIHDVSMMRALARSRFLEYAAISATTAVGLGVINMVGQAG